MANVFDAQVKAVDAFSGPVSRMIKGMRDIINAARGVTKTSTEGSKSVAKAAKESGNAVEATTHKAEAAHLRYFRSMGAHVRLLNTHFGTLNTSIGSVSSSFTKFLPMLGALGAGASLVGLFEMTKSAADATIQTEALTKKLGISAKEFGGLAWAAKESGVETDVMIGSLEKLNKTLGMAVAGKGKDAAALFAHLGIKMKDAAGHTRTTADLMPELANAFAKTTDPAMRALMATTLFGKQGQELLPVLMKGKDALNEMAEAGRKFAYFASPEQKEGLKSFAHNWEQLEAAVGGFKKEIVSALAPVLAPVIASVRDWVMANRDWIATEIADKVKQLATWIKSLNLGDIITQTTEWVKSVRDVIKAHGGMETVVGAVMLMLGSPLLVAIAAVGTAFMALAGIVVSTGTFMLANPIVAAVMAIAAAALLIYEYGDPIKTFFVTMWDGVSAAFDSAWTKIKPIVDSLKTAISWVGNTWVGKGLMIAGHAAASAAQTVGNVITGPTGDPDAAAPPAGLYREGGPALAAAQQKGEVRVKVDFANAPPGTQVRTDASGIAQPPDTSVGYSNPLAFGL